MGRLYLEDLRERIVGAVATGHSRRAAAQMFGVSPGAVTLVRRWRNQRPLMKGDRSHFYDQLVDRGWLVLSTFNTIPLVLVFGAGTLLASCNLRRARPALVAGALALATALARDRMGLAMGSIGE